MAFQRPTLTELINRIESDLLSRVAVGVGILRRAMLRIFARVFGAAVNLTFGYIDYLSKQLFASTSDSEYTELHGDQIGITKAQPTTSEGEVTFTGVDTTQIPADTVLQNSDDGEYTTKALVTISGGSATAEIIASAAGYDYNRDNGEILTLANPIVDIDDQVTVGADGLTGGSDVETDDGLIGRILNRKQNPPMGGNIADYKTWAQDTPGVPVNKVWPKSQALGPGTVAVYFMVDPWTEPNGTQISQVQDNIDAHAPVTATPTVDAPNLIDTTLTITVVPDTADVRNAAKESLEDLFKTETDVAMILYITQLDQAISRAAGHVTHEITAITIGGVSFPVDEDLYFGADELPILSGLIINTITLIP